jgi:signal transduction histidine kinase
MMQGRLRSLRSDAAVNRICLESTILTVALFAIVQVVAHVFAWSTWLPFDLIDVASLVVIAMIMGVCTRCRIVRLQRAVDAAGRQRRQAEAHAAENEAAIRVARVVAQEFAQPLSGALGYSELLMMHADGFTGFERRELEGLREGVLHMERLLQTLRQAIDDTPTCSGDRCVADDVERRVAAPRPRLVVRGGVAAVCGADRPEEPNIRSIVE